MHGFITMLKDGISNTQQAIMKLKLVSTQLIRNETVRMKVDCLIKSHEMHKKCIQSHPNINMGDTWLKCWIQ